MALQLVFQVMMLLLWLFNCFPFLIVEAKSLAKSGCDDECGGVKIPYPFGMNPSCYLEESYKIDCSSNTPTIHINGTNLEVTEISVEVAKNTIRVTNLPIVFQDCVNRSNSNDGFVVDMKESPFAFSETDNWFVGVGCDHLALLAKNESSCFGGCMSFCKGNIGVASTSKSTSCNGINCCQTTIPSNLKVFRTKFDLYPSSSYGVGVPGKDPCKYAYIVDRNWFDGRFNNNSLEQPYSVRDRDYVPAVLHWSIDSGLYHQYAVINDSRYNLSSCEDTNLIISDVANQTIVQCSCRQGFQGNPYVSYGCDDINECEKDRCGFLKCENTYGSYRCVQPEQSRVKMVVFGIGIGFLLLVLVMGTSWSFKIFKRKRKEKLKKKYFEQNGGLLLQEKLSSGEVNVEQIRMFPSKELDKATDRYNVDRMLGEGGQGTVYKGMLADGKIIAVKKSKILNEGNRRQFINEVVILSQINHRNVVKVLGCCLETEVPLLVYEFIPNGTLFQLLHTPQEELPLTWEMRLRIATEVAGALHYLHSEASIPIYHRDIKSANILLDEKYRAKVADFGISKSVTIDQTHVTTDVKGTFGYLDPEYYQSIQLTDKSDVYSFGVVLVELLTGEKAVVFTRSVFTRSEEEARSLVTFFLMSMENNHLFEILDPQVNVQGKKEDIMMVANLAKSCLRMTGKERPTMKEVTMVLQGIKKSEDLIVEQEIEYDRKAVMGTPGDLASASTNSGWDTCASSPQEEKPLTHTY